MNLVPCDSYEAGIFSYDAETGHLVVQHDTSTPPDAGTPFIIGPEGVLEGPEDNKYPGEKFERESVFFFLSGMVVGVVVVMQRSRG